MSRFFLLLLSLMSGSLLAADLRLEVLQESGSIEFEKNNEFISYVTSYDRPFIFFITRYDIRTYMLEEGVQVQEVSVLPHDMENAMQEYVYGFYSRHMLMLLKKHTLHLYLYNDAMNKITFRYQYPTSYFGFYQFTAITGVNVWSTTVVCKTDRNEVYSLDFRLPHHPTALKLDVPDRDEDILFVKVVDVGKSAAVVYKHCVELVSLVMNKHVAGFCYDDETSYMNYDYASNLVVLLLKGTSYALAIQSHWSEFNHFVKKRMRLASQTTASSRMYRIGPSTLVLFGKRHMSLYNMTHPELSAIASLTMPKEASEFTFLMTYRFSNLLIVHQKTPDGGTRLKHLKLLTSDNTLCHESCRGKCTEPFVPCKTNRFWLSLLISTFTTALCLGFFYVAIRQLERKSSRKRGEQKTLVRRAFTTAAEVTEGESGEMMLRFRPSKMSPSMVFAIEQELLEQSEGDKRQN